jgi:NADH-quinone oxidoreductase subunit J
MSTAGLYILHAFLAVGAAGLYLCLPTGREAERSIRWAARILGAAAVAAIAGFCVRWIGKAFDGRAFFAVFAAIAVVAAARVVTHPKPLYCALYFVLVVLAVTALCLLAAAEFLGAALVIVYAGAILVTYVFVIMLSQQRESDPANLSGREPLAAVTLGFLLSAGVVQVMASSDMASGTMTGPATLASVRAPEPATPLQETDPSSVNGAKGNVRMIGEKMMTTYVLAVETAGVLLLVALVGAVALARKRIEPAALTPEELARRAEEEDVRRRGREAPPF